MRKIIPLIFVCILANLIVKSAVLVDATVVAASGKHKLLFSVPDDYDSTKKYSLVIALHKYGGSALSYRVNFQPVTDSLKMIVACPDNSGQGFSDAQFDVIIASIDSAKSIYNIDSSSIFLNGMSLNATYVLHEGLKNLFPFKGIFPWAPYQPGISQMDLNSKVPVVLSIGTADEYGDGATFNLYDSLKAHKANVNLVVLPGITHTSDFPDFGNEMIRCLYYLNDTGLISIEAQDTSIIEMKNTDPVKELSFKVSHKLSNEIIVSSLSSDTKVVPNPGMTYTVSDSTVKLSIQPVAGKSGRVELILEAREKNGTAIKQMTTRLIVKNAPVEVKNINTHPDFFIYSNPATDQLVIKSEQENAKGIINIISITGQQVMQNTIQSKILYVDISNLKPGLYVIRIATGSSVITHKFVKQ